MEGLWLLIFIIFVVILFASNKCSLHCGQKSPEPFTSKDKNIGEMELQRLDKMIAEGKYIPEVSKEELKGLIDDIQIVKTSAPIKEGLEFTPTENSRYWPQYYYSFPYNYKYGGAWPPGMYSRLYFWSPGFYTGSGWSYYMRPGLEIKNWPRNRWIKNTQDGNQRYYLLSNGESKLHNQGNYSDTSLRFH